MTGSTGAVGRRVAAGLSGLGIAQRLLVRDVARAPRLAGAEPAVFGGYSDSEGMRTALEGVDRLFLVSAAESPDRLSDHETAIEAAIAAGVSEVVYLSFLGAAPDATFTLARDHFHTEQRIRESGLGFVFQRQSLYMDFLPGMVADDATIRGPGGDGHFCPVHRRDVADVATALMGSDGRLEDATYDVTGADRISFSELAEALTAARGEPVRYTDESLGEARESRRPTGAPDWEIEAWVTSYAAVASGELDVMSDTVSELTGHEPMRLTEFLAESGSAGA